MQEEAHPPVPQSETEGETGRRGGRRSRSRTPVGYQVCERITEFLIYGSIVAGPWLYGATEPWAVWILNGAGYLIGGLLAAKRIIRVRTDYVPPRWESGGDQADTFLAQWKGPHWLTFTMALLTVLIVAFTFVSGVNARATFNVDEQRFDYHNYISWLPHSYDKAHTLFLAWSYVALAFYFWGLRDWLLGKTMRERHPRSGEPGEEENTNEMETPGLPGRLRQLLWVISINGAVLAVEAILQRMDGTNKLLWTRESYWGDSESMFGPYSYRGNAADLFNLIWPVTLGLWWNQRQKRRGTAGRVGGSPHTLLIPCSMLIAAAPIISTSRGGALIAVAGMGVCLATMLLSQRRSTWLSRTGIILMFAAMAGLGGYLGWDKLVPRLKDIKMDNWSGRTEIYHNSEQMAQDFPLYGSGPGSFAAIYQLYRNDPNEVWQAYLHDDWLETRVTFGQFGFTIVVLMMGLVLARWFISGGIAVSWHFVSVLWVAVSSCLIHAKFDFPLQVYSVLQLFLTLCCILFCVSRRAWTISP
ncbi:MAG: O-Antigen ligase [Verrucomicrobiales bacterium]|nr:O-Antigen ligase [Verrucomicrobiales bacterium]